MVGKNLLNVTVIIPAYNEELFLHDTLKTIVTYLRKQQYTFEIIVINDGSTDHTGRIIEESAYVYKEIKYCHLNKNCGKGFSIKKGVSLAQGKYVLYMDADQSVSITCINKFISYLENGYAVVIASIGLPGAEIHDAHGFFRKYMGKFSKLLIRLLVTPEIKDTQRGFKIFTLTSVQSIFSKVSIDGWGFDIEVLVTAQVNGLKIKEVPVLWNNKKISSIGLRDYFKTFFELMSIYKNNKIGMYRVRGK